MRAEGLEPPRAFAHQVLSLERLANSATPAFFELCPVSLLRQAAAEEGRTRGDPNPARVDTGREFVHLVAPGEALYVVEPFISRGLSPADPGFDTAVAWHKVTMTDQAQREQESRESPETKFQEERDEERIEREHLAEESSDELTETDPEDD